MVRRLLYNALTMLKTKPQTRPAIHRSIEIIPALGFLLALSPILLAACCVLLITDGAPLLFRQERVGRDRKLFSIVKLRTMRNGSVTKIGGILRATGIDEIPQLWNVLRGDMNLVGPRPLTENDLARLGWNHARYDERFMVRPGMTGSAQLNLRGLCDARASWISDRWYVHHHDYRIDIQILAASFLVLFCGKRFVRISALHLSKIVR